jgi:hypothetical protein
MGKRDRVLEHLRRFYFVVFILILISLVVAATYSVIVENYIVLFVSVLVMIIILVPYFFRWKYGLSIPLEIEIVVVAFVYASLFLGEALSFYSLFWWWDILLHGFSALIFGFIGFIILYYLYAHHRIKSRTYMLALFSFSFAIAIGVVWEIFEFFMDTSFGLNMQKSGLVDTMSDLIIDSVGAIVASGVGYFYLRVKHTLVFKDVAMKIKNYF